MPLAAPCPCLDLAGWRDDLSGSTARFKDYAVGERIDHVDGMTVEEAEHMIATRLYQNMAVHFNQFTEGQGRRPPAHLWRARHPARPPARSPSNGLANAFHIAVINAAAMWRRCSPASPCLERGAGRAGTAGP